MPTPRTSPQELVAAIWEDKEISPSESETTAKSTNLHICMRCKRPKNLNEFYSAKGSYPKRFDGKLDEFEAAAKEGCRRCTLVVDAVTTFYPRPALRLYKTASYIDRIKDHVCVDAWPLNYNGDPAEKARQQIRLNVSTYPKYGGRFDVFSLEGMYLPFEPHYQ